MMINRVLYLAVGFGLGMLIGGYIVVAALL